jgi:hypothetical protein
MARTTKTTTKAAVKATGSMSRSSTVSKNQAEKFLAKVPEENAFWCNDGSILRDLGQLKESLSVTSDQCFTYHSNEIKKDYSNWVRDVIGDEKLAKELEKASNREQAAKIVEERLTFLRSKAD